MHSGFVGMLLVFGLIMPAILLGGDSAGFINVPSIVICIGMPIGLSIASAGVTDLGRALRALRSLFVSAQEADLTARNSEVLRHMISHAYAAGVIGTMIGWIQMLFAVVEWDHLILSRGLGVSILTVFHAIIISECILRPAARRIEGQLQKTDNKRVNADN